MTISEKVLNQVEETIKTYHLLNVGERIVVGVSGGADSMALLNILLTLKEKYLFNIVVAHVNHKIRKGDAENDAKFVEDFCNEHNIEFHLKEVDIKKIAKELNIGEEEAGRRERYSFFSELTNGQGKIATAHNANDNVETILMRLMRGTGLKGLSGIPYYANSQYGTIIRPILNVERKDIEEYLKENNITHITDKTNNETMYTRNKIRLNMIPYIQETFNPNFINTLSQNISSYNEDNDYIETKVEEAFNSCVTQLKNSTSCNINELKNMHPSIAKRVMIKAIQSTFNINQDYASVDKINEIYKGLDKKTGTIFDLGKDYQARISYENILFEKKDGRELDEDVNFLCNCAKVIPLRRFGITIKIEEVEEEMIVNTEHTLYLPQNQYKNKILSLRTKKDDDVFRINDDMSKKLNKYLSDKKIDLRERNHLLLFCDKNIVLSIVNYSSTRFNQRNGKFFKITLEKY
jgi:tRNA(Ile)-lysidine synthase